MLRVKAWVCHNQVLCGPVTTTREKSIPVAPCFATCRASALPLGSVQPHFSEWTSRPPPHCNGRRGYAKLLLPVAVPTHNLSCAARSVSQTGITVNGWNQAHGFCRASYRERSLLLRVVIMNSLDALRTTACVVARRLQGDTLCTSGLAFLAARHKLQRKPAAVFEVAARKFAARRSSQRINSGNQLKG